MSKEITNNDILQAILELSQQQRETTEQVNDLSQQLVDVEKRLSREINIVAKKIDLVPNRLLETEAEVSILKRVE